MQQHALFSVLLLLLLLSVLHLPSALSCPVVLPRVIGGHPVSNATLSFLASIAHPNNTFSCTASLISPTFLLTAAHCNPTTAHLVRLSPTLALDTQPLVVQNVFIHPQYSKKLDEPGDIALIQLRDRVRVAPLLLNHNASIPVPGAFSRTAGYGRTNLNRQPRNPAPREVDSPVNSPVKCKTLYEQRGLDLRHDRFLCAGYGSTTCHAEPCKGDSGGPLIQYTTSGKPVQIAIVSFGDQCGTTNIPSVYVRVNYYLSWIRSYVPDVRLVRDEVVVQTFANGSDEAANDSVSNSQSSPTADDNVVINRVWFAVICVIAGIALVALIFMSFVFLAGRKDGKREKDPEYDLPRQISDDAPVEVLRSVIASLHHVINSFASDISDADNNNSKARLQNDDNEKSGFEADREAAPLPNAQRDVTTSRGIANAMSRLQSVLERKDDSSDKSGTPDTRILLASDVVGNPVSLSLVEHLTETTEPEVVFSDSPNNTDDSFGTPPSPSDFMGERLESNNSANG